MGYFVLGAAVFGAGMLFGVAISESNLKKIMDFTINKEK